MADGNPDTTASTAKTSSSALNAAAPAPTVRVDLHCHSDASDGYYEASHVADFAAEAGVDFAALTDHQTIAGLMPFHDSAARHGMTEFAGAELHALFDGIELHLLAYGFDPESPHLRALLPTITDAGRAIEAIHAAGGIAILAHPLSSGLGGDELEPAVERLSSLGLDGIEAYYKPYPPEERERLAGIADRFGLLTSAGSDFHGPRHDSTHGPGIEMPVARWKQFREALGDHARNGAHAAPRPDPGTVRRDGEINWRWLLLRIVLPSLLVIGFFVVLLFAFLIPSVEERLLDRKREMTSELTNSAWSIVSDYHREVEEGSLSLEDAQQAAVERIRRLRYGPDGMDYFWITDMHPRMVMHPYRPDLEGTDLTDFTDPDGVRPFVEFVEAVRERSSGYVTYVWQWQDDPDRLEAKESYVRGFEPWGWVIGTGLYVDDVQEEIRKISGRMVDVSFLVTFVAGALLLTVAYQSLKVERKRSAAERDLRASHERYRTLVESSTSGSLLLVDGRCTYANRTVLEMLGYTAAELAFLDIHDVVVRDDGEISRRIDEIAAGGEVREAFEVRLKRRDGTMVLALLSSSPAYFSGRRGVILTIQSVARHEELRAELGESRAKYEVLAENISSGVFRAAMDDEATILEMNPAARLIFGFDAPDATTLGFRQLVADQEAFDSFIRRLRSGRAVRDMIVQIARADGGFAMVNLSAVASDTNETKHGVCAAIMEDVSERRRSERDRENLISQLQTSLLFLTEPVGNSMNEPVSCSLEASIAHAVRLMGRHDVDAVTVVGPDGELLGILTDHDVRERVVAAGVDTSRPVSRVMSAPVVTISESSPLFEAFLLERERGIDHLAVTDSGGHLVGVIRSSRAVRLDRYSLVVLTHQIARAATIDDLVECHDRLPALVGSLVDSGARSENICHVTTAASDAIAERVIGLMLDELGPPPARFAFLALGSEAREEQTLATDQDNALVYEDAAADSRDARTYFLKLGELVCDALDRIGYRHCRGDTMAKNPRWNQPLERWKQYFTGWVAEPDRQALAHCNVFFDRRCIYGDSSLHGEIRRHVDRAVAAHPAFFSHLALATVQYRPPVGFFGKIVTGASGEPAHTFNIKDAMVPIVNFARLYALKHHLEETNTHERLEQLNALGVLQDESYRALSQAYDHLMQLRYRHQADLSRSGRPADNSIDPRRLTQLEVGLLKTTFSQIAVIQKKVGYEFRATA